MKTFIVFAFLNFFLSSSMAKVADFQCPPEIKPNQTLSSVPSGWNLFVDTVNTRHLLEDVNFYDGPPEELALLKPDDAGYWRFTPSPKRAIFQVCGYSNSSLQLSRALPDSITSCRATYEPTKGKNASHTGCGRPVIKTISCK